VLLSGLTVAIGLIALVVLPVPSLRSVGIGGMLIPLVSVLVSLTLLPALLGGIGQRMDWPRVRHEASASRVWSRWARAVVRHRLAAAGLGIAILAVLVAPVFSLTVGMTSADAQAQNGPAHDAYQRLLDGGVPAGVLTPIEVLTTSDAAPAVRARIATVRGIATADVPVGPDGTRAGYTDVIALPREETVNSTTLAVVRDTNSALAGNPGVVGIAGIGAIEKAYGDAVFSNFPLMFALIMLATFVLLARAFRSILLAAKAVVLNLISLAATFGLLTFFWQQGYGSNLVFGIPATGAITFWIPLMVFAFLFGLSMDYEVFILTRVREEYDRTGSTTSAVVSGLARTGRLVTSAALILFLAFASLAAAPNTDIKVLATGLGAGILLDATVVRRPRRPGAGGALRELELVDAPLGGAAAAHLGNARGRPGGRGCARGRDGGVGRLSPRCVVLDASSQRGDAVGRPSAAAPCSIRSSYVTTTPRSLPRARAEAR
jgi:putative drug exporter of the RND superfamily